jgi:hypothetical protein
MAGVLVLLNFCLMIKEGLSLNVLVLIKVSLLINKGVSLNERSRSQRVGITKGVSPTRDVPRLDGEKGTRRARARSCQNKINLSSAPEKHRHG